MKEAARLVAALSVRPAGQASYLAGFFVPPTREVNPADPVAYVLSLNLHRRQLTPSQRSMVGAKAKDIYEQQAKERQKVRKGNQPGASKATLPDLETGQARDAAGKAVGVGGKYIDYASKVLEEGTPELVKAASTWLTSLVDPTFSSRPSPARLQRWIVRQGLLRALAPIAAWLTIADHPRDPAPLFGQPTQ